MPILYGVLALTDGDILRLTPYEVERRIEGYAERQRLRRIFTASFITAPIMNANGTKHHVTAKKLLPKDFGDEAQVSGEKIESLKRLAEEQEERRHSHVDA